MDVTRRIGVKKAAAGTFAIVVPVAAFIMLGPTTPQRAVTTSHITRVTTVQPASRQAARQQKAAAGPATYRVQAGDSLSSIAKQRYNKADDWTVIYWANHGQIRWADIIRPGQILHVPAKPARAPRAPEALAPVPPSVQVTTTASSPVAPAGTTVVVQAAVAPVRAASYSAAAGSFQQCVISRESGGDAQIMNGTGHYGLYQFSAGTWAAYGGNPGDFGNASVAEQNRVFGNAIAAGGQSNWSPYDGC